MKLKITLTDGTIKEYECQKGYILGKDKFCFFTNKQDKAVISIAPEFIKDECNLLEKIEFIR